MNNFLSFLIAFLATALILSSCVRHDMHSASVAPATGHTQADKAA